MAASVSVSYLVEESYVRTTATMSEIRDVFLVSGLTSGVSAKVQALTTMYATIPFGSVHPADSRMVADEFDAKPFLNSTTQVKIYVTYHPIDWSSVVVPRITFTGTSREVLTNYAADGSVIKVNYKPGATTDPGAHVSDGDGITTVVGQVIRNKKFGILEIERVEYASPRPMLVYIDKMNSATFWGQPKYTWAVNNIVISKLAYVSGFNVKYLIEYDPQTHIKTATYRDEITGTIPKDINTNPDPLATSGNGWRNSKVNGEANFTGLGLPDDFV